MNVLQSIVCFFKICFVSSILFYIVTGFYCSNKTSWSKATWAWGCFFQLASLRSHPSLREVEAGAQRWALKWKPWRNTAYWPPFLHNIHLPRAAITCNELHPPTPSNVLLLAYRSILWSHFLSWDLLFFGDPSLCQRHKADKDKQANKH